MRMQCLTVLSFLLVLVVRLNESASPSADTPLTLRVLLMVDESAVKAMGGSQESVRNITSRTYARVNELLSPIATRIQVVQLIFSLDKQVDSMWWYGTRILFSLPPIELMGHDVTHVWIGSRFPDMQFYASKGRRVCHAQAYSLVSIAGPTGDLLPEARVARLLTRSFAVHTSLLTRVQEAGCACTAASCITDQPDSGGDAWPSCAAAHVRRTADAIGGSCLTRGLQATRSALPVCLNGVIEGSEEACDCLASDTSCRSRCSNECTLKNTTNSNVTLAY